MKKIIRLCLVLVLLIGLGTGCKKKSDSKKITIMTSSFPSYDIVRAITKGNDNIEVKMLLKPGSEMHHFEPTPKDIANIQKSKIFIYVGGDSDEWVNDVLKNIDTKKTKVIKLMDLVDLKLEEDIEGMEDEEEEEEEEYDEHVWTSPLNVIKIINSLSKDIIDIDEDNKELYEKNSKEYKKGFEEVDNEAKDIVKNSKRKEIIFGDRFPIMYFTKEYGIKYYAAFPGCSEQTEASAKTISFLIDKVKEDKIPVVFHIELSNGKIAKTIADATKAKVLEFNTGHNISQKDFDKGLTLLEIMKNNNKVLKEALY